MLKPSLQPASSAPEPIQQGRETINNVHKNVPTCIHCCTTTKFHNLIVTVASKDDTPNFATLEDMAQLPPSPPALPSPLGQRVDEPIMDQEQRAGVCVYVYVCVVFSCLWLSLSLSLALALSHTTHSHIPHTSAELLQEVRTFDPSSLVSPETTSGIEGSLFAALKARYACIHVFSLFPSLVHSSLTHNAHTHTHTHKYTHHNTMHIHSHTPPPIHTLTHARIDAQPSMPNKLQQCIR